MKPLVFILAVLLCGCGTGFMGLETVQYHYSKVSTKELQLRHAQCENYLDRNTWEVHWGNPLINDANNRGDRIKEKENIEKELLHRYTNGDKEAYLPMFGPK